MMKNALKFLFVTALISASNTNCGLGTMAANVLSFRKTYENANKEIVDNSKVNKAVGLVGYTVAASLASLVALKFAYQNDQSTIDENNNRNVSFNEWVLSSPARMAALFGTPAAALAVCGGAWYWRSRN